jgi:hypothetical protein
VALEVVHMAVRRLLAVRLCHRFRLLQAEHGMGRMRCSTDIPGDIIQWGPQGDRITFRCSILARC